MSTNIKILIVDDNEAALFLAVRNLDRYLRQPTPDIPLSGVAIGVCTAEMALRRLNDEGPFDVVLTDIGLPLKNGYDLLQAIRAGEANTGPKGTPADIPVFATSGYREASDIERQRQAGFTESFGKPVDWEKLLSSVYAWVRERSNSKSTFVTEK